ncbi:MAG: SAM-dependent methyltransferase [Saprospiraceae bacterium]|nr:SAM-dependent methyltransferase [Saprospiraceae bacterium]
MEKQPLERFVEKLRQHVQNQTFIKITLAKPKSDTELKNLYGRIVEIKKQPRLSLTFRYKTRDEVKNYDFTEGVDFLSNQIGTAFMNADMWTTESDMSLQIDKKGEARLIEKKASHTEGSLAVQHNHEKTRRLDPQQAYFHALEITDAKGSVTPTGQKKFRQIDKYIEIIESLVRETDLPNDPIIVDMGSGKGYLTFALYDFLKNNLKQYPSVFGIELRPKLVEFCNKLSEKCRFEKLSFIAQDINTFETERLDMLIALHACDTATDIAIAKGIRSGAKIIVVAPCCHKQLRKQLKENNNVMNEMSPILRHGIMEERQAELLTDGIRALLMEAHGYKTKVFEFISTEHTPKNVMIVGIKGKPKPEALVQVAAIKKHYGIGYHALEQML